MLITEPNQSAGRPKYHSRVVKKDVETHKIFSDVYQKSNNGCHNVSPMLTKLGSSLFLLQNSQNYIDVYIKV